MLPPDWTAEIRVMALTLGGVTDESNGCFLGFICVNANANLDGTSLNASADDEGVDVEASND
jgi:hypothetical protein